MSEALFEPPGRTDDRLLLTIVIAAAVHVMVVLGVRLPPEAPVKSRFSAMEVELVPAAPPSATSAALTAASDGAEEPPLLPMAPVEKPVVKAAPTPTIAEEKPTPAPMATVASKPTPTPKSRQHLATARGRRAHGRRARAARRAGQRHRTGPAAADGLAIDCTLTRHRRHRRRPH